MATSSSGSKIHLETFDRISSIPLVENGIKHAEQLYKRVKNDNRLFSWYFQNAESTVLAAYESIEPAVRLFESPLKRLDNVMCKCLDIVEQRIPLVYLPPELMYWNTKEYMNDHLVKPVLKRADSVKQIRNAVLESSLTYAADRIDGAFTVGDKFVDKYLIPIGGETDQVDAPIEEDNVTNQNEKGAIKAIHHGQRFSRKLKRRLTQRTLAEARALKKQSKEAIHILLYAAELIATDPKLALQKAKELWDYLSQDEPENQARPVTLEQLIVLITRESARRVVHLINFSANAAANIPKTLANTTTEVVHHIFYFNNRIITITKLDKVKNISKDEAETVLKRMLLFYSNFQGMTQVYLERLATFLSGRIEAEKVSGSSSNSISTTSTSLSIASRRNLENQGNNSSGETHNNINGIY
jgi:perilipin-2